MFEWSIKDRHFHIREASGEDEFHAIEDLQRAAWQFNDLDVVPFAILIASQWAGGVVLAAFQDETMIGFAYGFPGYEHGRISIHSHMLAVKPEARNFQAGFYLKLAQREWALGKGLNEITWTFDPLQSLNAHLNFAKLGVVSDRYIVNFYGESSSSPLHQGFGTDRLWVRWPLDSDRVRRRIDECERPSPLDLSSSDEVLVHLEDGEPKIKDGGRILSGARCLIEIPHDITAFKQREPSAAARWRMATREAFQQALGAGFVIEELLKVAGEGIPRWFYLLVRDSLFKRPAEEE